MRVTVKYLDALVSRVNRNAGFDPDLVEYNTIGAYRLYRDQCGYALHRVMNEHGGIEKVGGNFNGREMEAFILGYIAAQYR